MREPDACPGSWARDGTRRASSIPCAPGPSRRASMPAARSSPPTASGCPTPPRTWGWPPTASAIPHRAAATSWPTAGRAPRAASARSGQCVDGVCCASACPGACQACNVEGAAGTCMPVPAGQDPDNECAEDPPAGCQRDGACDGSGGCRLYPAGVECQPGRCEGATEYGGQHLRRQGNLPGRIVEELRPQRLHRQLVRCALHATERLSDRVLLRGRHLPAQAGPGQGLHRRQPVPERQLR